MTDVVARVLLIDLYIKKGFSVASIASRLKCSQNKINYWLSKYGIPKRSISDALYLSHNPDGDPFKVRKADSLDSALLLGLGLGLYWGEGNKRNPNTIRLGNTDPLLIKKFIKFLRVILGVPILKLRFGLQIFSDMNPNKALGFWLRHLKSHGVSRGQFQRLVITQARSIGTYRQKSKYGVLTVYCGNIKLKHILDKMLAEQAI